jgi:hypothetical protein
MPFAASTASAIYRTVIGPGAARSASSDGRCSHGMRLEELEQECDDKVGRNGSNDYRCDHQQNS